MMKRKGSVLATIIFIILAILVSMFVAYYMVGRNPFEQPEENTTSVFVYKFNGTIYIDNHGEGWLVYNNGTHTLAKRVSTIEDWRVIG